MITAYLTICILAFGSQACWPERAMDRLDTEETCWAKIDNLMTNIPHEYASRISLFWRCGGDT